MKKQKNVNVIVVNTKGGAGKSTTAMQTIATYFLAKAQEQEVELLELDNQNQDAKIFSKSKIKSTQINVDANAKDLNQTIRDLFLAENKNNIVLDIGGNATTYNFLQSLKSTHMYNMVDLFVIPMSGGSQDLKNAKDTLEMILGMKNNAKILFALSRVRNPKRVQFQYGDFFQDEELKKYPYIILPESDCIDLSRKLKKTVYELAQDEQEKENINQKLLEAFDKNDKNSIYSYSLILEILEDSENYKKQGVVLGDTGAFNSVFEFKNSYNTANILNVWKNEFLDEDGNIRGIVIAKSYECKPYGIKTGTSLKDAIHMCPNLMIIPSDHLFYQELSQKLKAYLELKIPLLEQYSIDEFFGDLNGWIKDEA
jgi:nitrogenase subunit NifH